jgi:hypothetical protein
MKLITSLSISAFVFMPAIAFAENSPSSTGTVSQPNQEQTSNTGGQKFYPDWAAVKKIAPSSQTGATAKPNDANNQQKSESMTTNGNSSSSANDQPGLVEKAKEKAKELLGK